MSDQTKNPQRNENAQTGLPNTNRLINEKSPYLLLHAQNPVDWYPWGDEAFEKARRDSVPIFLSVGYYTCHWCHVMEEESFANPAIAEIMNRYFVSIKVDREERPDVDRIYMTFVQAATGSGGWPMSVFLTPDLKPFFGGTYWPPDDGSGRPGFRTVLLRIAEAWKNQHAEIIESADHSTAALAQIVNAGTGGGSGPLTPAVLDHAYEQIKSGFDSRYGGFGGAPKFPRPVIFNFLLRHHSRTGQKDALEMTLATLRAMAAGGLHDHLGGGFHRYSTDARWHVPHFEKMLYDQAQLAISYTEAFQITHDSFFADAARDILDFSLREMRSPEGGFYSAEDADSQIQPGKPEQGEGAFYVWTAEEIESVLGPERAALFDFAYGVEPSGNVSPEQDFRNEFAEKNILCQRHSIKEPSQHFGKSEEQTRELLAHARRDLFMARAKRPHPPIDDKIVTSWNGLMISALARASEVLDDPKYLSAAEAAARFVEGKLDDPKSGQLKRRYRAGDASIDGFLDDYAFLIRGLLDLYEASLDTHWLVWAVRLQERQDQLFWDPKEGGYFAVSNADSSVILRTREDYDGAEPSPNSVAAMNLLRLAQITGRRDWDERAKKTMTVFSQRLESMPEALPQMVAALDFSLSTSRQIIIAGARDAPDTRALLRLVNERFIPNRILLLADGAAGQRQLALWNPFIESVSPIHGKATAYICENFVCKLPASDLETVRRLLDSKP